MFKHALVRLPGKSMPYGLNRANDPTSRDWAGPGSSNSQAGPEQPAPSPRQPSPEGPDYEKALLQHRHYVKALATCAVQVVCLEALEAFPDSCFIEDVAVLAADCAVVTRPGAPSRQGEPQHVLEAIKRFYEPEQICFIEPPGFVDGGDVLMVGQHFYVGLSGRTNPEGCQQLISHLQRFGYSGEAVPVSRGLHLKTRLSWLQDNLLLLCPDLASLETFRHFDKLLVPPAETPAANCLRVNDRVLVPDGYPQTRETLEQAGCRTLAVDISEYEKLDGGLSCLSLRF